MNTGSSYLRLMAENLIKIAAGMLTEANRLDGITVSGGSSSTLSTEVVN